MLNGVRATDLGAIFGPACSIGATLRYLRVDCEMTSPLRLKDVKDIVEKCEGVEELQLGALWGGEAVRSTRPPAIPTDHEGVLDAGQSVPS